MSVRIAVANLQSGIGVTRGYRQYATQGWKYALPHDGSGISGAANYLAEEQPDILLATEIDAHSRRTRRISQVERLQAATHLSEGRFFSTRAIGASVNEGNAILASLPILSSRTHPLPLGRTPRVLGEAKLLSGGRVFTAFVAHLSLNQDRRRAQLREIARIVRATDGPVLLGGDFNERNHGEFRILQDAGLAQAASAPGYPSWQPRHALVALFLSPHFRVERVEVDGRAPFSDHLPLIADLDLS
jgi:endonuclease/exonuclease/phosphatase family metal-dependent hydrolase